jgi:hypothetical protein
MTSDVNFTRDPDLTGPDAFEKMFDQAYSGLYAFGYLLKETKNGDLDGSNPFHSHAGLARYVLIVLMDHVQETIDAQKRAYAAIDNLPEGDRRVAHAGVTNGTIRGVNVAFDFACAMLSALATRAHADGEDLAPFFEAEARVRMFLSSLQIQTHDTPAATHATTPTAN